MSVRHPRGFRHPARSAPLGSEALPGLRDPVCGHRPFAWQTRIIADSLCQAKYDSTYGPINNEELGMRHLAILVGSVTEVTRHFSGCNAVVALRRCSRITEYGEGGTVPIRQSSGGVSVPSHHRRSREIADAVRWRPI